MRKLSTEKRAAIINALAEGNSIASTCRIVGCAKLTVLRLLADVGSLCRDFHDWKVRGLRPKRLQADELWSFVGCKAASKRAGKQGNGDCWTWTCMDADSKLMVAYRVGQRTGDDAHEFMADIADRVLSRPQLTTDAFNAYTDAVEMAFGSNVDYAQLEKIYKSPNRAEARRYSPPQCVGTKCRRIMGNPDEEHISTSYVERLNLSLRMRNRRYTRLVNSFSKRWTNHAHAFSLQVWHYNWARKHKTLGETPAMAAGLADAPMTVLDLVRLLEAEEKKLENGGRINREDRS
jgi:IS1 family transposase